MRFAFIARHWNIWPVAWLCDALDVSRSGFHAGLNRSPSAPLKAGRGAGDGERAELQEQRPHL